jgi:predicted dehydrogenase
MSESKHPLDTPKKPSRREFLKASGVVVGAAVAGNLALGRSAHAAGSDTIKIGLVGCGGRGSGAAANAMNAGPDVRLIAMADLFDDKIKSSREELRKAKPDQVAVDDEHCFVGFDGCKNVIASGVDVVLIATASAFHPQYLKAAIDAGKHAFAEKPHGIDPPGIRSVLESCEQAKKKNLSVVSGLCWRYHTGVQETMKRILDGAIGEIIAIQETYMRSPYRLVERRPEWSEIEYQFRNWYHFNWLSGDDIAQSLVHSMDKAAWAMKDEPPVKVFGQGGRSSSMGSVFGNVFDHHALVYEYANGAKMFAFGRAQNGCHDEVSDYILGTKGSANLLKFRIEGEKAWRYEGPESNMYDLEHVALFDAIRSGKPINNGIYAARSSMLAVIGEMSCYSGREITWEDAMKSNYQVCPADCRLDMAPPVKPDAAGIYPVAIPGVTQVS